MQTHLREARDFSRVRLHELRQQDYHGKRIYIEIQDSEGKILTSKIDLGVHKHYNIAQVEFCFDVGLSDDGVSLLINSIEQMFTEKLRSVLKFGALSTRYKDIFDMYYLTSFLNKEKLMICFDTYIFSDAGMREQNLSGIIKRVENTFADSRYLSRLKTSKKNWIDADLNDVLAVILDYLRALQ